VIARAEQHEGRLVTLGSLVLFSTETGDAWMLDVEDSSALCLARSGERQPFAIVDAPTTFSIEWNGSFRIEDQAFIVTDSAGTTSSMFGYPIAQIREALHALE
jgi:hypothetical protein